MQKYQLQDYLDSCQCPGHLQFEQVMKEIKKNGNYQQYLQAADDLYGIKQYNILDLKPKKIIQLYNSVCNRVYMKSVENQQDSWVSYELKIFVWLIVCHLYKQISDPQSLSNEIWQKYRKIFHNKNIQLIQYQAKLVSCGRCQPRKWQKEEQELLASIIKPTEINSKWNQVAKTLYLKSNRKYFRNPKQVRQHWLNHLNPQISKECWTIDEDILIIQTVLQHGKRWAFAAKLGGGKRTEHMIKNRFYALVRNEQKNHPSIHDKQKILKLLHKKLIDSNTQTEIVKSNEQIEVKVQNQFDNSFTLPKQQFKSTSFDNEQYKPFPEQKSHKNSLDIMQIEYKHWWNGCKKIQQIQLYQLGIYEEQEHNQTYQNYQMFFTQ